MSPRSTIRIRPSRLSALLAALCALGAGTAAAQGPGEPSPVGYTEAREAMLRPRFTLTGSVEARSASVVASEVSGLVVELAAREGDVVRRGQKLVQLRRRHLELERQRVEADLGEAKARLALAESNLERSRDLFDEQVVSRSALDDAISENAAWRGRVESLQAQLARVEDDLAQSAVTAPFPGVVVRELTQVGEWLSVGGEVAELLSLDDLEVVLEVPERSFASLEVGAPAEVTFEALPGVEVEGRIGAVIPRADPRTRTFPVKVRFGNPGRRVGVGMLARVSLPVGEPARSTVVPKDAVAELGEGSAVYVIGDDSTVRRVPVETGNATGVWIAVGGEIAPGDRVVTRGNERLRPGQPVRGEKVEYELP